MTVHRAAPFSALHFSVQISGAGLQGVDLGFSEVVFPTLAASPAAADGQAEVPGAAPTLVLRRGFDGRLHLYRWWDQARRRQAQRGRTVTVRLLEADSRTPVTTWRFSQARPLLLAYSPLDALHGGVLIETLTLGFASMTLR